MSNLQSEQSQRDGASWRLSWDAVLFIVLWSAQFWSSELSGSLFPSRENDMSMLMHLTRVMGYDPLAGLLLITLFLYVGADLWLGGRRQIMVKWIAVWLVIIAFVLIPTVAAILYRHNSAPYLYIHDGAIQVEEAVKFLLAGRNPYAENYLGTPMAQWAYHAPGVTINPALYHLPYLPLTFLAAGPCYQSSTALVGWYDQRLLYLAMFIALVLMLIGLGRTPREKLAAVMLVALNPLFVPFFIEGRNDVAILFWLVGAILFLQRGRVGWAAVWLACAAASKQTAWFLLPFFAIYILRPADRHNWRDVAQCARVFFPALVVFAVLVLPFLFWNPTAFVGDVVNFQSGISPGATDYPIQSLGLGSLLLGFEWVKNNSAPFPFWIFQVLLGGLTLAALLIHQWRDNTLPQMVKNYAICFLVVAFFSRTFNDNHLGFALIWLILPSFIADDYRPADAVATR